MSLPKSRELLFQSVLWVLLLCTLLIGAGGMLMEEMPGFVRPPHLMLLPGSALVIVVAGIGLLALVYQRPILRISCVVGLALLLLYGLLQLVPLGEPQESRWLPPMSLLMVLVGAVSLALVFERRGCRAVWCLAASFFIAVGAASLLFYLRPEQAWLSQDLVASSLMGGIFCLLFGSSMWIVAVARPWRFTQLSRAAMLAGALGVFFSGIAWYLVSWQQYQHQREALRQDIVHLAELADQQLDSHSRLIMRLATRWQGSSDIGDNNRRDLELRSYLRDFPSLEALSVSGRQGEWRRARHAESLLWLDERLGSDDVQQWIALLLPGQGEWYFPAGESATRVLHGVRLPGTQGVLSIAAVDVSQLVEALSGQDHLAADVVQVVQGRRPVATLAQQGLSLEEYSLPIQPVSELTLAMGQNQPLTFTAYAAWPGLVTLAGLLPLLVGALGLTLTYQLVASLSLMASRAAWGEQLLAAGRELRVSEQRFRSLFTKNPEGVFTHSREGTYESINLSAEAILGLTERELRGKHFRSIVHEPECSKEDVERTESAFQRAVEGDSSSFAIRFSRDGINLQHLEVTMMPIVVDGEVDGVFGIAKDITARVAAEERLRVLERSLDASLNGVIISEAGRQGYPIIYVNQAFTDITGYEADEVIGRDWRFLQGPETEAERIEEIRQGLRSGQDIRLTLRHYRKDSSVFWDQLYVSPVMDMNGCISHFIAIVHDISERKAQEKELAYHATHDPLTGLANRALLEERLSHDVALGARHNRLLGVLFIDLDEFKPINDTHGSCGGGRGAQAGGKAPGARRATQRYRSALRRR
ncbi:PAS domain S-box protein [Halomonas sp. NO4]|uniref:PAS domain S-box protein n=1 Tax=Halomonas sp. NO4 TaxID=2484813 RepID=UPI0013D61AE8|nr:PAS domain S-box protein [Halomonas sp. NO4]